MIGDDAYVELALCCARACHVLKTAPEGKSVDSLSDPSKKQIENLGRCVDPVSSFLPIITSGIRTVRLIQSAVSERANCAGDLRGHYPGPTKERLVAWRTEIQEMQIFCDVCACHLSVPTAPKLPQGNPELDDAFIAGEQCAQSFTKTKPSKCVSNEYDLPVPAEPSLALLQRLISGAASQSERASLIETIFSSRKATDMICHLRGSDIQTFIDVVDEVRYRSSVPKK